MILRVLVGFLSFNYHSDARSNKDQMILKVHQKNVYGFVCPDSPSVHSMILL